MAIVEIPKEKLMGVVVPALKRKLRDAEHNGIKPQKLKGVVQETAGLWPSDDLFNRIMWIVGYKSVGGLYYANGFGPEKPKKEKKPKKVQDKASVNSDGQSLTYEGGDLHLVLKGKDKNGKKVDVSMSPVKKVIIIVGSLLLIMVVRMIGG